MTHSQLEVALEQLGSLKDDLHSSFTSISYSQLQKQKADSNLEGKVAYLQSLQRQKIPFDKLYDEAIKMYFIEGKAEEAFEAWNKYKNNKAEIKLIKKLLNYAPKFIDEQYTAIGEKLKATQDQATQQMQSLEQLKEVLAQYAKKIPSID